jgi:GT2 family glycosyltransferase
VHENLPGFQGAMIGVVVPAYNREDNLALLLASLERQSAASFHVVIADDGSTDGTAELIAPSRQPTWRQRLARVRCGPNQGCALGGRGTSGPPTCPQALACCRCWTPT